MRKFIFIAIFLSVCTVVFFIFGSYATNNFTGRAKHEQTFEVKPNEDLFVLAKRLEQSGIVFSRYTFLWKLFDERKNREVIAGNYALNGNLKAADIVEIITSGKTVSTDIKITFPEGWPMKTMAERLTTNQLPGDEFLKLAENPRQEWRTEFSFLSDLPVSASLEGYLFPDTYLFAPDATGEVIVESMLKNFGKRVDKQMLDQAAKSSNGLFAFVTMASIIEEEGKIAKDRSMISDVFWKRIAIGQPLQSDATVNYVLGTSKPQSSYEDILVDSPYNTYKYKGLPPGPISNPGLVSLKAALFPEQNSYYYFLNSVKNNGETVFSTTFEEHVRNRQIHGL